MTESASFNKLQAKMFDSEHGAINKIYVDMELLQDLKFGALLTTITVKEELSYIYSKLAEYSNRTDLNICSYFPALKKKEADISAIISNPDMKYKLAVISPFTTAYDEFIAILMSAIRHNSVVANGAIPSITLNIADMPYPIDVLDAFINNLKRLVPKLAVTVTTYPRYSMSTSTFITHDMFFLLEMHNLVKEFTPIAVEFVQNGSFFGKKLYALPYIDKTLHKDPNDYDKILVSTEYGLGIYCDFKYISSQLVTETINASR